MSKTINIYIIEPAALAKTKEILEAEDFFEVKGKCKSCKKILEGKIKGSDMSKYEPDEKGTPPEKKCECGSVFEFEKKQLVVNEFARNGYILRAGQALGLAAANYLYIKAENEFFAKNEPAILKTGAKKAISKEADKAKEEIEKEQDSAAAGIGGIFDI